MRDFFCVVGVDLTEKYYLRLNQLNVSIMAKIKFGMMMTDARGKLGGQVFSKNRSGAYVRTKVTPVNPRTVYQQENRSLLGSLSSSWSALLESQRLAWNSAVEQWQKTNVFGDLQRPTGKNLFTSLNKNMLTSFPGSNLMLLPPSKSELSSFAFISASISSETGAMIINLDTQIGAQNFIRVLATPPVTAGTNYVDNLLRVVSGAINSPTTSFELANEYVNRFGLPSVGDKIFVQVQQVFSTGELGTPQMVAVIVAAE